MRIADVRTHALRLPIRFRGAPPQLIGGPRTHMDMLLVRVETEGGVVGWGEAFGNRIWPATQAAIDGILAPAAIGRDAADIDGTVLALERLLNNAGRNGPGTFGLSGIDIALWDIAGKVAGLPLHRLLRERRGGSGGSGGSGGGDGGDGGDGGGGGDGGDGGGAAYGRAPVVVPAYASLLRYGEPALLAEHVAEALARGYRIVKLHEVTVDAVLAARQAAGAGVPIMIDVNCPWSPDEAIAMARRFAPGEPWWLEEPVWPPDDFDGLARVRRDGGLAIAAGENCSSVAEFDWMLRAGAVDFVQPSVGKVVGLTGMRRIVTLCGRHRVRVMPHCTYLGPGLLATAHALAAWVDDPLLEHFYLDVPDDPYLGRLSTHGGRLPLPETPGLGIDPDEAAIERLAVTPRRSR